MTGGQDRREHLTSREIRHRDLVLGGRGDTDLCCMGYSSSRVGVRFKRGAGRDAK